MSESFEIFEDVSNPLDSVEDVLHAQDWVFTRACDDELSVQVSGKTSTYQMTFVWQEEFSAMQFFCECDMSVPGKHNETVARLLQSINERLWLGHFDISDDNLAPCFRHTSLFRGWTHSSGADHIQDLIDIALAECERYHTAFSLLSQSLHMDDALLKLALSENEGRA
ncbi:MAG: YbjN domain-containing protein [Rhodospirillales bacterium]|nr:YbjN domain-containing protein [Rhodospirillales bacterium]